MPILKAIGAVERKGSGLRDWGGGEVGLRVVDRGYTRGRWCLTKAATFIVFVLATPCTKPATVRRGHHRFYKIFNTHLSSVLLGTDALKQPHSTCQKI